jgi:hypothetical protein
MPKKIKMPKARNFFAAAVRNPNGPFRPTAIPNKKAKIHRKSKHKGHSDD